MNKNKYDSLFTSIMQVSPEELPSLCFKGTRLWDSIGHLTLINAIEEAFDISLDDEDIFNFSSYIQGIAILNKYGIDVTKNV